MKKQIKRKIINGEEIIEINAEAQAILYDPILNKGTGFTHEERGELGLHGLLPTHTSTIEQQVKRRYANFQQKKTDIDKHLFLTALQDRNETLFYRFLLEHPEEMLPYIYTPTVGDASLNFSYFYNQNRGIYISYPLRDHMDKLIESIPKDRIDVIVLTDGGRILGLGDLGIGGMAIPVGKLSLYSLFGGINPAYTLPITLDVGTNNSNLLADPLYLGWRHERISGDEYSAFIDMFIKALHKRFPNTLIQWEDFSKQNAQPLLEKYQNQVCCFNDDIQGTAGVVMAGVLAALEGTSSDIKDQRVVIYGAGSAGIGIAHLITQEMMDQGMSEAEAKDRIYVLGRNGLAHSGSSHLDDLKKRFAQPKEKIEKWNVKNLDDVEFLEVIQHVHPTILIGTSAQPGSFTEEIIKEIKKKVPRPIIFPLSNPTSKSEAIPKDLLNWTNGSAIIATGSPFKPVEYEGKKIIIGQCNNVYIFPGVGLGVITSGAKKVTDKMFLKAAKVLAHHAPILNHPYASLYPPLTHLRTISKEIAVAICEIAKEEGIATKPLDNIEKAVDANMWYPKYAHFKKM